MEINLEKDLIPPKVNSYLEEKINKGTFYPKDHNKEIKNHFDIYIEKTRKVLKEIEDINIEEELTIELKKYLSNYSKEYIKYLELKSKNPSWIVTGRGGLNIRKYNKNQNLISKNLNELNSLSNNFDDILSKIKSKAQKEKQKNKYLKMKEKLDDVKVVPKFTRSKEVIQEENMTLNTNVYKFDKYKIYKLFGNWRVLDEFNQIIFKSSNLSYCKKYIALLID